MLPRWVWILIIAVSTAVQILLIRQFTITQNWVLVVPYFLLSLLSLWSYYMLFRTGEVGIGYAIITGSAVVLVALGGFVFFGERFTWRDILGIALIVTGVILLVEFG